MSSVVEKLTRDQIVKMILTSRTKEEVSEARTACAQWMSEHPEDLSMLDGSAGVERKAEALGLIG